MDNAPAPAWWRNPTIIAAIIAAVAAIIVAVIGLTPKSSPPDTKPQQTTTINQTTSGSGSPAVGQAGGDVTITNEQSSTPKKK
jgi:hypothetical protein